MEAMGRRALRKRSLSDVGLLYAAENCGESVSEEHDSCCLGPRGARPDSRRGSIGNVNVVRKNDQVKNRVFHISTPTAD
jgi:hypothetical protein